MYTVTRQIHWPDGEHMVEISKGSFDYTNPGALVAQYPGESQEYASPIEAVKTAIEIKNLWGANSDEEISLGHGYTGGMTMPFDACSDEEAMQWAEKEEEELEKCAHCGSVLGQDKFGHEPFYEYIFCSEYCSEQNFFEEMQEQE